MEGILPGLILLVLAQYIASTAVHLPDANAPKFMSVSVHRERAIKSTYVSLEEPRTVEVCTHPSVTFRVFGNNTFWQVRYKPRVGKRVIVGKRNRRRSLWVMEYINVTSSDPKWVVRTKRAPKLYITYDSSGEVTLQDGITHGSYFNFEITELNEYVYRVPGSNKTLGVLNNRLHVVSTTVPWSLVLPHQNTTCPNGRDDLLAIKDDMEQKWYRDSDYSLFEEIHVGVRNKIPLDTRWLSRFNPSLGWTFRTLEYPTEYIVRVVSTDELKLKSIAAAAGQNSVFGVMNMAPGKGMVSSPNPNKYINIQKSVDASEPDTLRLHHDPLHAVEWNFLHLGFCCDGTCFPSDLYARCVSQPIYSNAALAIHTVK